MRLSVSVPKPGAMAAAGLRELHRVRKANQTAVDQAGRKAHARVRAEMSAAGLGKLPRAVKFASSKQRGTKSPDFAYAAIYADRGDKSRAGQALRAYSEGATIGPRKADGWLAFPTAALKRVVGFGAQRARMTPALFKARGYERTLGKLRFKKTSSGKAILFVTGVDVSNKTGLAVARGKRLGRTRSRPKSVVLFILIRSTVRTKRFDQNKAMQFFSQRVPDYISAVLGGRAGR